jgi:hypothetical protein
MIWFSVKVLLIFDIHFKPKIVPKPAGRSVSNLLFGTVILPFEWGS